MCGIIGLVAPTLSHVELQRVADLLTHRGPDDAGYYLGDGIGLAARRRR